MVRETVGSEATWAVDSMVGSAPPQRPPGGPHPAGTSTRGRGCHRPPHRLPSPYATGPTPRPARARSPPPSRSQSAATHAPDPAPRRARIDLDARLGGGSLLDLEGAPRIGTTWTLRIPILRGQGHFPVHRRSPYEARLERARLGRGHGPPAQYACCETDSWTTKLRLPPCGANGPRRRPPGCGQVGSAPLSARANAGT